MKRALVVFAGLMLVVSVVWAAAPKTYQVTGPVLEIRSDVIVVQKGDERWEIAKDAATKITGELKVGAKVTITYRMTAATVEVKPEAAKPAPKAPAQQPPAKK